jgi:transcriptional regulator with XRE-family HTH domain
MADMLGIDRSYLSEIETGKKDPSLRVLKTIADGFKVSLSQLLPCNLSLACWQLPTYRGLFPTDHVWTLNEVLVENN